MKEFSREETAYLAENAEKDPGTLMLQASRHPHLPVHDLVRQIQARQKARHKLPTWFQNPQVYYPAPVSVEQASSEQTAAYKAGLVKGSFLIDLTGGFGIDTFYFARKFNQVWYVEQRGDLAEVAEYNAALLGAENIHFHHENAADFLGAFPGGADVFYLDPARRDEANQKVHLLQDCEPDVLRLLPELLAKARQVLIKTSPMLDIQLAIEQLQQVESVTVVAVENECKEVLYLLGPAGSSNPEITAVNLLPKSTQLFDFSPAAEEAATVNYGEAAAYIYEPHAAIMKAGGYKALAQQYQLTKLARNSHLYTSENLVPDFPGRTFRRLATCRYQKKELLAYLPQKKANITVRNFPDTVAQIRIKTGIKEGGHFFLFATTDMHQKLVILVCEKII